jgi:tetratricopeptide (TPR) repeat protein
MQASYPILIHSAFYKILRESSAKFRTRVRKTLLRLRDGQWGGGTQVKRLAGVGQAVFEARVDAGDRLLFTAVRAATREDPERLATHLQIWDVVHHDSVTRRARHNLVPEAGFLDFKLLEAFDITEPPPEPAAAFDEVSPDGSEPLLHLLIPEEDFEPRGVEGIQGGVRWYLAPSFMLADESEFQRMIDRTDAEFELKLMRDQYEVLRSPGPLLLAGGAGSGKTTIAVHRLVEARCQTESGRLLYLSYSPWLVDYAKRLYRDITVARGANPDAAPPQFFTFGDFYRRLAPEKSAETLVTAEAFASWLRRSSPNIDPALVWEELRSILKGACLNLGRAMLEEREYYDLGRKRAPLFVNDRPEIFAIAQRYQEWLASNGLVDQIDLCRAASREARRGHGRRYDVIVCDEVQDLTELEAAFVLSLSAKPDLSGVMLTGDTQQIVNPTGFRWAEVRQAIVKATGAAPKPMRLRRNCRSVRPLVELANSILGLRQELFGRYEDDGPEDAVVEGPAPIQVAAEEKRVLAAIRDFGPRCAILVLDETEALRLSAALDTTRIFHVRDAKGLEFETVVLWKLLASANGVVDRFVRSSHNASLFSRDTRLKQFLQHLYVAVTRARRNLAIFDGAEKHPFWGNFHFLGKLELEGAETLNRLFRNSATPAEWAKEGEYYFDRLRYRQAAECYRRAGLADRETAALAMHSESLQRWQEALSRWQQIGNLQHQGILLEKLGRLTEALDVYVKLGRLDDAARLELRLLEKEGRWAEAARRWEDAGNAAEAARCYQRAGNKSRALTLEAEAAANAGDWKRAAECWFSLKAYQDAARCFRKCRDKKSAALAIAHHHEMQNDWGKAAAAYLRAGDRTRAQECKALALEAAGETTKAAKLYERLGQKDRALQLYRKAGDQAALDRFSVERADVRQSQTRSVKELIQRRSYRLAIDLATRRRALIDKRLGSLKWYMSDNSDRQLLDEDALLQDLITESKALLAEQSGAWSKAERLWRRIENDERANAAREKAIAAIPDGVGRGIALLNNGDFKRAFEAFESAGSHVWSARAQALIAQQNKDWLRAADLWKSVNDTVNHAAAMARFARSQQDWKQAAHWHRIAGEKTLTVEAERSARAQLAAESVRLRAAQETLF